MIKMGIQYPLWLGKAPYVVSNKCETSSELERMTVMMLMISYDDMIHLMNCNGVWWYTMIRDDVWWYMSDIWLIYDWYMIDIWLIYDELEVADEPWFRQNSIEQTFIVAQHNATAATLCQASDSTAGSAASSEIYENEPQRIPPQSLRNHECSPQIPLDD